MTPNSSRYPQPRPNSEILSRRGFRARRLAPAALALAAALVVLPACTSGSNTTTTTGNNGTTSATATTAPTATPKPKPTSVPTTSVAYCQGLLSLADVNSIMNPAAPASNILFENDTANSLSACSWAQGQTIAVLAAFFLPFPQGTSLNAAAQQMLAKAHAPAGGSFATTPVSGVGDQALYVSATVATPAGPNYIADLVVAYGRNLVGCAQTGTGSLPAGLRAELTQACTLVVSRL
jgi:hypothetical protein